MAVEPKQYGKYAFETKIEHWSHGRWKSELLASLGVFTKMFNEIEDRQDAVRFFLSCIKLLRLFVWHEGVFWRFFPRKNLYQLKSFNRLLKGEFGAWSEDAVCSLFRMWGCLPIIHPYCIHIRGARNALLKKSCTVPIFPELNTKFVYRLYSICGYYDRLRKRTFSSASNNERPVPPVSISDHFSNQLKTVSDIEDADERRRIMTEWTTAFAKS